MKRSLVALLVASGIAACGADSASAIQPANYGFLPFGFYQPYGVQYGTSVGRPPHFAVNPPVYYGARHARPYGLSPFASPPLVSPPESYKGRLRSKSYDGDRTSREPHCNPYVTHAPRHQSDVVKGEIRTNPFFAQDDDRLAENR